VVTFFLFTLSVSSQEKKAPDTLAVKSIDAIVNEVLEIVSGEPGEKRDWDKFRNLFLPTATFTVLSHDESAPHPVETISLNDFIELMDDPYYDQGFKEYEINKIVEEYNGIAQVFQAFHTIDSQGYEGKGMTSYQLIFFKDRWWISSILWTGDSNGIEVPDKYLGK